MGYSIENKIKKYKGRERERVGDKNMPEIFFSLST